LIVLAPGTVADARWMLGPALADPDPVLLFEHGGLYNVEGSVEGGPVDIRSAAVRQPGEDVTIATYGGSLPLTLDAAEQLAGDGIAAEVVDLRVLRPLDQATLLDSTARTHRLVVVDEGWRSGSLSAELVARVTEEAFYELDAPPERVCTAEVPLPYAQHLERAALPSSERIVAAVKRTVGRDA
jgi:pyruvate dehydrogenase E1 component beta subunit